MKMTAVWYSALRSLDERPDDGGSTHLWNVSQLLQDYTAQYPRKMSPLHIKNCEAKLIWYPEFDSWKGTSLRKARPNRQCSSSNEYRELIRRD
jgi:hypothetical protein